MAYDSERPQPQLIRQPLNWWRPGQATVFATVADGDDEIAAHDTVSPVSTVSRASVTDSCGTD